VSLATLSSSASSDDEVGFPSVFSFIVIIIVAQCEWFVCFVLVACDLEQYHHFGSQGVRRCGPCSVEAEFKAASRIRGRLKLLRLHSLPQGPLCYSSGHDARQEVLAAEGPDHHPVD